MLDFNHRPKIHEQIGALIDAAALPLAALRATGAAEDQALSCLLAGGDDYELLFTAPPAARTQLDALASRLGLPLHRIGHITPQPGQSLLRTADGTCTTLAAVGYDHFT